MSDPALEILPATAERWADLEALFGPRGACGGCWCMWWRIKRADFERSKGEANRAALRALVAAGTEPGLVAYAGGEPVGWCALEPRERYPVLERSRTLKPVDEVPVWSVTCFFVRRDRRGTGVSRALLRAAIAHAERRGAPAIEGYPVDSRGGRTPDTFAWTGPIETFRGLGFREIARRSATRPILRRDLANG